MTDPHRNIAIGLRVVPQLARPVSSPAPQRPIRRDHKGMTLSRRRKAPGGGNRPPLFPDLNRSLFDARCGLSPLPQGPVLPDRNALISPRDREIPSGWRRRRGRGARAGRGRRITPTATGDKKRGKENQYNEDDPTAGLFSQLSPSLPEVSSAVISAHSGAGSAKTSDNRCQRSAFLSFS